MLENRKSYILYYYQYHPDHSKHINSTHQYCSQGVTNVEFLAGDVDARADWIPYGPI